MVKYDKQFKKQVIEAYLKGEGGYKAMENFFGLMKQEMYYGETYRSFEELKRR